MNKLLIASGAVVGIIILSAAIGNTDSQSQSPNHEISPSTTTSTELKKEKPICDGTTVTTSCSIDGVDYATYIYHPAAPVKSHQETVTTYEQEVSGYCTLCNDDTYSPTCATGRGACSHHGGVAVWNAPQYRNVPVYSTKTVVDAPAQEAYYEKLLN
jgi:hypothetical protein